MCYLESKEGRANTFQDDRELIRAVIDGDPRAAEEFVGRFSRFVYAILERNLRFPAEVAEDLYQQVFLRLWDGDFRALRNWRGEGDFASYLGPIVRNLALSRGRKIAKEPVTDCIDSEGFEEIAGGEPTPEELAAVEEQRRLVEQVVSDLGPRDREIYRLRFVEQRKHREIAAALGMETNAVGVALVRLERRLARRVPETAENKRISRRRPAAVRSDGTEASPE